MAKQVKDQPDSEEEQSAEAVMPEHEHAEFESIAALKEQYETLMAHFAAHDARIAELEKHAHSDHALSKEAIDQIATHAANHAEQHITALLHAHTGNTGRPLY